MVIILTERQIHFIRIITIKSYNYVKRKTIYLCLAKLSDNGAEQKYVQEAFDTNWVVPMGPNVTAFEEDLRKFVTGNVESAVYQDSRWPEATSAAWNLNPALKNTKVVCLSAGTAAVHCKKPYQ